MTETDNLLILMCSDPVPMDGRVLVVEASLLAMASEQSARYLFAHTHREQARTHRDFSFANFRFYRTLPRKNCTRPLIALHA